MQRMSIAVSTIAAAVLAVGSIGLAQASPHANAHGLVGEDTSLARGDGTLASITKLYGKVNDNRDMTLSDTTLSSGRYRIIIKDSAKRHNWHIFGSGVDKETSVRGTGRWSWKVRLRAGTYKVVCDRHAQNMNFSVSVS